MDSGDHRLSAYTHCMAEVVPYSGTRPEAHRDALVVRGMRVIDIISAKRSQDHTLTSFGRVQGARIIYPLGMASRIGPSHGRQSHERNA